MRTERSIRSYRLALVAMVLTLVGGTLLLNCVVDPLWHFAGNQITGINIGFNERQSKLNLAKKRASDADCVIYGSSRATLLDGRYFAERQCFNMAVSEGLAPEFPHYARALKQAGLQAKWVVLGADDLSFFNPPDRNNAPAWLRESRPAPMWWQDYLALDALQFSLRALAGKSPTPRYYRPDFSIAIEAGRRVYRPSPDELVPLALPAAEQDLSQRRTAYPDFMDAYRQLQAAHADAHWMVYVPPISLWRLAGMIRRGELEDYLDSIHRLTTLGAPVMDFSVPSALTADASATYDGSHFDLASNRRLAAMMMAGECEDCLRVDRLTRSQYRDAFHEAYRVWRKRMLSDVASPANGQRD